MDYPISRSFGVRRVPASLLDQWDLTVFAKNPKSGARTHRTPKHFVRNVLAALDVERWALDVVQSYGWHRR